MEVDKQLILRVAANARLKLTDEEVKRFIPELKDILETFAKLKEVDTKNVKPSFHPVPIKNVLRDDIVEPSFGQEKALRNSEHKKDGYFKGPRAV